MLAFSKIAVFLMLTVPSLSDCPWNYGVPGTHNELDDRRNLAVGFDEEFTPGEYGWFVVIEFLNENSWIHACGASIISQDHVVTAAHCFCDPSGTGCPDRDWSKYRIRLAGADVSLSSQTVNVLNVSFVEEWLARETIPTVFNSHPKDLAVARISPLDCKWIEQGLNAIEILDVGFNKIGCTSFFPSMGYWLPNEGKIQQGPEQSGKKKQETFSTIREIEYCARMHAHVHEGSPWENELQHHSTHDEQFCVYDEGNPHEKALPGDSGSPLMLMGRSERKYYVAGVSSHILGGLGMTTTVFQGVSVDSQWILAKSSQSAKVAKPDQCIDQRVQNDHSVCESDPNRGDRVNARIAENCDLTDEVVVIENYSVNGCGPWGTKPCKLCCNSVGTFGFFILTSLLFILH